MDDYGNIVVAWAGPPTAECAFTSSRRIFAQRFYWSGSGDPVRVGPQFPVENNPFWEPARTVNDQPQMAVTVALFNADVNTHPELVGRFIVAWSASRLSDARREVRGQYFGADGRRIGREARLHAGSFSETRELARGNAHTVVYGPVGQVIATYLRDNFDKHIWFTMVPPTHASSQIMRGDCITDGRVDDDDIPPFVTA